jgi:hypothetical protein
MYNLTQSYWTDTTIDNSQRSLLWIVYDLHLYLVFVLTSLLLPRCNEVGFLLEGPPDSVSAIVSRLIQPIYDEVCSLILFIFFPL